MVSINPGHLQGLFCCQGLWLHCETHTPTFGSTDHHQLLVNLLAAPVTWACVGSVVDHIITSANVENGGCLSQLKHILDIERLPPNAAMIEAAEDGEKGFFEFLGSLNNSLLHNAGSNVCANVECAAFALKMFLTVSVAALNPSLPAHAFSPGLSHCQHPVPLVAKSNFCLSEDDESVCKKLACVLSEPNITVITTPLAMALSQLSLLLISDRFFFAWHDNGIPDAWVAPGPDLLQLPPEAKEDEDTTPQPPSQNNTVKAPLQQPPRVPTPLQQLPRVTGGNRQYNSVVYYKYILKYPGSGYAEYIS
ncbi:hypothetical protein C8R44DRAFT_753517 [Mycena epipterygia]|nr:hypothetical protein C8R44DRAFT_753517 [Mycena epipterygia]